VSERLPNGLAVSILPDPSMPRVATQVWVRVGSANEDDRTRGFAHLFEHLMFGGTAQHPKRALWDAHERHGGDVNAYTSFDETVYVSAIPPVGHAEVLAIEADRMTQLALSEDNLANEKRIVTEELRTSLENDPFNRLASQALARIFGEHPYSLTPLGTQEDIAAATLDYARGFYARWYRPDNAHLVVVGPVDAEATLARIRETFGALPAGSLPPSDVPAVTDLAFPERIALKEDIPPVEVAALGFPLPPATHPDAAALRVALQLLGGGGVDPFEDELVRVRKQAIAAGTTTLTARRGGLLAFYAANLPYRREQTAFRHLEEARGSLASFRWLDAERLAAAKRALRVTDLRRSRAHRGGHRGRCPSRAAHLGLRRPAGAFLCAAREGAGPRVDVRLAVSGARAGHGRALTCAAAPCCARRSSPQSSGRCRSRPPAPRPPRWMSDRHRRPSAGASTPRPPACWSKTTASPW
jgi:predicted Zn-dependent peptidase